MSHNLRKIEPKDIKAEVLFILAKLEAAGFRSFLVGGAVRDLLLGLKVSDYDITTPATPDEVSSIFTDYKLLTQGKKHGTVSVLIDNEVYEITSFRKETIYLDHRHPKEVKFSRSLKEDTKRRDFTINQIAYNPQLGLIDYHEGIKDLKQGLIRAIGKPERRFSEDALRILRCFRFAATYNFKIEENTYKAANSLINDLDYIAGERIQVELEKLLGAKYLAVKFSSLSTLFEYLFPYQSQDFFIKFNPESLKLLNNNALAIFILLAHTDKKEHLEKLSQRLKLSNFAKRQLFNYGLSLSKDLDFKELSLLLDFCYKNNLDAFKFMHLSLAKDIAFNKVNAEKQKRYKAFTETLDEYNLPLSPEDIALDGNDLINLNYQEGPIIKKILHKLWLAILEGKVSNDKDSLIKYIHNKK